MRVARHAAHCITCSSFRISRTGTPVPTMTYGIAYGFLIVVNARMVDRNYPDRVAIVSFSGSFFFFFLLYYLKIPVGHSHQPPKPHHRRHKRAHGKPGDHTHFCPADQRIASPRKNGPVWLIVKCSKPLGGKADCCGASEGLVRWPEARAE